MLHAHNALAASSNSHTLCTLLTYCPAVAPSCRHRSRSCGRSCSSERRHSLSATNSCRRPRHCCRCVGREVGSVTGQCAGGLEAETRLSVACCTKLTPSQPLLAAQHCFMRPCAVLCCATLCNAVQAEVDQQHQHIRSMIQQLQQQEQLMIADLRAAKVRAGCMHGMHATLTAAVQAAAALRTCHERSASVPVFFGPV